MSEHTILVAFDVEAPDRVSAQKAMHERLRGVRGGAIDSWWVAEDDRIDGSDNDSAVFVPPGYQEPISRLLGDSFGRHMALDRPEPVTFAPDYATYTEFVATLTRLIDSIRNLHEYVARASDDAVKTDLELIHEPCGEHLCDVEADDALDVLLGVATDHVCDPDNVGRDSDAGEVTPASEDEHDPHGGAKHRFYEQN